MTEYPSARPAVKQEPIIKCPQCGNPLQKDFVGTENTRDESGVVWSCAQCQTSFEGDELG